MSASKLDAVYRSFLITKFFTKGWGKPENLRRLFEFRKVVSNREECIKLVERDYPVTITKEQNLSDCRLLEGYFTSPLERYLPGIVPEVAKKAHFQVVIPLHWPDADFKPMCLHLAGTGDHYFWRRRNLMVRPLLKEAGIGGIILENPFYGLRKPTDQVRSSLHNVSDIFVMGGCLVLESLVLFHWCERNGLGPLGVTGLSMGGHMASLAATNWPKPLVLVPCLSWSTASAVFLQGVMSQSINWDLLEDQYLSDGIYREKLSKMVTIVDEAFLAGKKFARTMSRTMEQTDRQTNLDINKPTKENLDITYNESKNENLDNVKEVINSDANVAEGHKIDANSLEMDGFAEELKRLLDKDKISVSLYEKLTANEKFELEPKDIEEINNWNEDRIMACVARRFKIGKLNHKQSYLVKSDLNNNTIITNDESKTSKTLVDNTQMHRSKETIHQNVGNSSHDNKSSNRNDTLKFESKKVVAQGSETDNQSERVKVIRSHKVDVQSKKDGGQSKRVDIASCKGDSKPKQKSWNLADLTSDIWMNFPFVRNKSEKKININKVHWRDREALQFMRGVMDECTHLSNFSVPYDTSLIIAVCARHDAYVPRDDVGRLEEIWPGAEVRYVDAGHVSAYILHQKLFRASIVEAFERSKKKWKDGKHIE